MRIYIDCKEAVKEIEREIYEMGIEVRGDSVQDKDVKGNADYFTKELSPYSFMILDTADRVSFIEYLFKDDKDKQTQLKNWCNAEIQERLNRKSTNPGEAYKIRDDVWDEFIHDGKFAYTYSERISPQIDRIGRIKS